MRISACPLHRIFYDDGLTARLQSEIIIKKMIPENNFSRHNSLIIRAGNGTLAFLVPEEDGTKAFYQYPVKSGMSIAANLREAFKEQTYLNRPFKKALLMVNTPIVLIPREDYEETENFDAEAMYSSVLTGHKGEEKIIKELPQFEAMALYAVNRDLKMVVGDNCQMVDVTSVMMPIWEHLYKRYYINGNKRRMFAYFHDKCLDICCFEQRRIHFANVFDAQHSHDAIYYLLFAWKQLGMRQQEDELFVLGEMPDKEWLAQRLKVYIANVNMISPSASLNRSALSQIEGMPFDMMV